MKKVVVALFLLIFSLQSSMCQIGAWRNYLAYHNIQQIQAAGNDLFVMASNDLYQYNQQDQSIRTYDKVNGLSDTHITHICWCQQAKRLVIVYANSNIDLMDTNGNITNISDLYTKSIIGDKTVSSVRMDGQYAYLICGFGIVKVNVQRAEIADTYNPTHPDYPTSLPAENNSNYDKYIDLVRTLNPGGPKYNYFHRMLVVNNKLYTVGGGWYQLANFSRPGTIQVLRPDNEWDIYQDDFKPAFASTYHDATDIAIDPRNENHVMIASCSGVFEFLNGKYQHNYTSGNNNYFTAATNRDDPDYVRTDGIIYDQQGNLYCLNSGAAYAIVKRNTEGEWSGFMDNALVDKANRSMRTMTGSILDHQGRIWFVNAHSDNPSLYCYEPQENSITKYNNFVNQDGTKLQFSYTYCVCEDLAGNIWIGTDVGPMYLSAEEIADPSRGFIQYKVPRNDGTNYADYLLSGISISFIAVDKAGRKWFGTNGDGVYLISEDNNTQEQHFTESNSKLLSNTIESIAINNNTGEVFFGTSKGLCSYVSDATTSNDNMDKDNVWAYPNPVTPDYTGLITVKGLSFNTDVKICNASGTLIAEGHSNGGTFTWDGCDKNGNQVASGVYMVLTAKSDGSKGTVCKIAIIR